MPEPKTLMTGLAIGESPRWHDGRLWLANWGAGEIIAVDVEGKGELMTPVPTTMPISIDWLPDGRLLVVSGPEGRLLCREADGSLVTHAELGGLSDTPWNEIVVDGRGNAYVNCTGFHFGREEFRPGILARIAPDGSVRQVAEGLAFPNGMLVTPDNATLIVAESYANRLTAFDVAPDGGLSNRRVWAELSHSPDGICLDADGAVWSAAVGGKPSCVRVREGGQVLQQIDLDLGCFACMLGGEDGKTLFLLAAEWRGAGDMRSVIAARTGKVLTMPASAPHAGWP